MEKRVDIINAMQLSGVNPSLRDPVEYRKSGLSLNHIVGCPLDCSYCVRHLFGNFDQRTPQALMTDKQAFEQFISHRYFQPHITPVQLFNRATDPMLPEVKPHMRIPRSSGHPFHEHLTTDSTLIRPPIPRASGH